MAARSLLALGLAMVLGAAAVARAEGDGARRISVTGEGEVRAVPDIAQMSIGVETQAATPGEALAANAARMTAVMDRLQASGIAAKDLQTSQLGLYPVYRDREQPPEVAGYRATNQLAVTLRAIERLGEVLDAVVADGANAVSGPAFSVAEPEPLFQAARDAAVKDAIARAGRYAAAAGVSLGMVLSIDEAAGGPVVMRQKRFEAMDASTPVAAGETSFSASVTMTFAID